MKKTKNNVKKVNEVKTDKNFIIKIQEKMVNFRIQLRSANSKAKDSLNASKQRDLQNKLDKDYIVKDIKKKKLQLQLDNSVRFKGVVYLILSILSTFVSTCLTVLGVTNTKNFKTLFENNHLLVYAGLICLLQTAVWIVGFSNNYIKDNFNTHYTTLTLLQKILIGLSMTGNYLFLSRLIDAQTAFDHIFVGITAISLDIVANKFSEFSQDCLYLNYTYKKEEDSLDKNDDFFKMLFFILTYRIKLWVKTGYIEKVNAYKTRIEEVENKYKDVFDNNDDNSNSSPTTVCEEDYDYNNIRATLLNMKRGEVVSAKIWGLSTKAWRNVHKQLVKDNLIVINGKRSLVA